MAFVPPTFALTFMFASKARIRFLLPPYATAGIGTSVSRVPPAMDHLHDTLPSTATSAQLAFRVVHLFI